MITSTQLSREFIEWAFSNGIFWTLRFLLLIRYDFESNNFILTRGKSNIIGIWALESSEFLDMVDPPYYRERGKRMLCLSIPSPSSSSSQIILVCPYTQIFACVHFPSSHVLITFLRELRWKLFTVPLPWLTFFFRELSCPCVPPMCTVTHLYSSVYTFSF